MAIESRLIQVVQREARKYLFDTGHSARQWSDWNWGQKNIDVPMPFKYPSWQWYLKKIEAFTWPSRETLIAQGDIHTKNQGPFLGEMNMFMYDAKFKKTLPYWDRFPLVIPIYDRTLNYEPHAEFMGINFHYLSVPLRVVLLNKLVGLYVKNSVIDEDGLEAFNKQTRLVIKDFSELILKSPTVLPCIKHYLNPYITSNIRRIKASEFIIACLLPLEDFKSQKLGSGGTIESTKVWRDSENAKSVKRVN